jgi:hypothetical protein
MVCPPPNRPPAPNSGGERANQSPQNWGFGGRGDRDKTVDWFEPTSLDWDVLHPR